MLLFLFAAAMAHNQPLETVHVVDTVDTGVLRFLVKGPCTSNILTEFAVLAEAVARYSKSTGTTNRYPQDFTAAAGGQEYGQPYCMVKATKLPIANVQSCLPAADAPHVAGTNDVYCTSTTCPLTDTGSTHEWHTPGTAGWCRLNSDNSYRDAAAVGCGASAGENCDTQERCEHADAAPPSNWFQEGAYTGSSGYGSDITGGLDDGIRLNHLTVAVECCDGELDGGIEAGFGFYPCHDRMTPLSWQGDLPSTTELYHMTGESMGWKTSTPSQ